MLSEIAVKELSKSVESALLKSAKERMGDNPTDISELNKPIGKEVSSGIEKTERYPEKNGTWEGERGNSVWQPDADYVPPEKSKNPDKPFSNPDKLTWGELLQKYNLTGIEFKDGFPVFDSISKGTVEIEDFEPGGNDAKQRNFAKADKMLAEQKGCSPEDVRKWRKENNYTWHECEDMKTMQKVPNEIHANVPHAGGRSQG